VNAGFSLNRTKISFSRLNIPPVAQQKRTYRNEVAPRISVKKTLNNDLLFLKATISRGFSPPTVAELLPSTGIVNINLEPEYGWNYELTAGIDLCKRKLKLEATGFYFRLDNALVQRRDSSGADFFVNAGDTKQRGVEISADYWGIVRQGFIEYLIIRTAYTYNAFRYGRYIRGVNDDYSGNTLPSVPKQIISVLADVQSRKGIYTNITYYGASKIFLNDANTAFADSYHLLGCRLGWKKIFKGKNRLNIYAGVDNLLDEIYSLGNDINAPAGRFYNAAPPRNYYAGISFQWIKSARQ
jgi:iron complex outermembrane receptor protein